MRKSAMLAGALSLAASAAACTSFLTDNKATTDPYNPSKAAALQLFVGTQQFQFLEQEGNPAFITCLWMQQCQGVGGRFASQESEYTVFSTTFNPDFAAVYGGGGLLDLKAIEATEETAGDLQF